jgi:hypothetical protein
VPCPPPLWSPRSSYFFLQNNQLTVHSQISEIVDAMRPKVDALWTECITVVTSRERSPDVPMDSSSSSDNGQMREPSVFIGSDCNHVTDEPTHSNSSYADNRYADRRGHGVLPPVLADKLTTGATLTHVTAEYMCGGRLCISKRRQQELVTKVVSYRGS